MSSRAARDMASCMKSGGKAKKAEAPSKMPPAFAKKAAPKAVKAALPKAATMKAPAPLKLAAGGVAKLRHGQSTPAGKQKAPPKGAKGII